MPSLPVLQASATSPSAIAANATSITPSDSPSQVYNRRVGKRGSTNNPFKGSLKTLTPSNQGVSIAFFADAFNTKASISQAIPVKGSLEPSVHNKSNGAADAIDTSQHQQARPRQKQLRKPQLHQRRLPADTFSTSINATSLPNCRDYQTFQASDLANLLHPLSLFNLPLQLRRQQLPSFQTNDPSNGKGIFLSSLEARL
ncbi:hypothetical protein PRZ48_000253 [Zasmidium cellare]|uniref:Uncharacterized protein n=1 Tax=Zasmidium cellare TaxID=395010 RepID=A0ABR0EXX9_ZASCE|nr:hypothetical protein PRZ48_000253 [Zasmidium cellare]